VTEAIFCGGMIVRNDKLNRKFIVRALFYFLSISYFLFDWGFKQVFLFKFGHMICAPIFDLIITSQHDFTSSELENRISGVMMDSSANCEYCWRYSLAIK